MDWRSALAAEFDVELDGLVFDRAVDIICMIFKGLINPPLVVVDGCIRIPEEFTTEVICMHIVLLRCVLELFFLYRSEKEALCTASYLSHRYSCRCRV